jgi:hypothetical protein
MVQDDASRVTTYLFKAKDAEREPHDQSTSDAIHRIHAILRATVDEFESKVVRSSKCTTVICNKHPTLPARQENA